MTSKSGNFEYNGNEYEYECDEKISRLFKKESLTCSVSSPNDGWYSIDIWKKPIKPNKEDAIVKSTIDYACIDVVPEKREQCEKTAKEMYNFFKVGGSIKAQVDKMENLEEMFNSNIIPELSWDLPIDTSMPFSTVTMKIDKTISRLKK